MLSVMPDSLAFLQILSNSIRTKQLLLDDEQTQTSFMNAAAMVLEKYLGGTLLYIMGNGGSAANAQHLAAEFNADSLVIENLFLRKA